MTFSEFFRAATAHDPYPYQGRLVEEEPLPQLLNTETSRRRKIRRTRGWRAAGASGEAGQSHQSRPGPPFPSSCPSAADG